jgi:hypothetical protein
VEPKKDDNNNNFGQERCATKEGRSEEVVALQHAVEGLTKDCVSSLSKTCPILGQTQ